MLVRAGVGLKNSLPTLLLQPPAATGPVQLFLTGGILFGLCTSGSLLLQQGINPRLGVGVGERESYGSHSLFTT